MKRAFFSVGFFFLCFFVPEDLCGRPRIAVLPFRSASAYSNAARIIPDMIGSEFLHSGDFELIERIQLQEILKEQSLHLSGCTEISCAVDIGRLVSAENVLIGVLENVEGHFILNARIIDVSTGRVLAADNLIRNQPEELFSGIRLLARGLGLQYRKEAAKLGGEGLYYQKNGVSFFIPEGYTVEDAMTDNSCNITVKGPAQSSVSILLLSVKVDDVDKFRRELHESYRNSIKTSGLQVPKKSVQPVQRAYPGLNGTMKGFRFEYYFGTDRNRVTVCENQAGIFDNGNPALSRTLHLFLSYPGREMDAPMQSLLDSLSLFW